MPVLGHVLKRSIKVSSTLQNLRKPKLFNWQKKVLRKLLFKARGTAFGKSYNFDDILPSFLIGEKKEFYEKFKQNVPVYDYNKIYKDWWHRAREGEENVCWPGKVKHFALSSGTSEAASKAIPVTKEMIRAIQRTSINQIISLGNFPELPSELYEKGYLMLGGSTQLNKVASRYEGDLSGITQANIPYWFSRFYKPGKQIASLKNWEEKLEEITLNAPKWDIGFIAGVPAWVQLLLERIIDRYQLKNIHELWPNLSAFAWGGVSLEPYRASLNSLMGQPIFYIETYLASEGFLAYQVRNNGNLQLVLNNGIFFEFIPFTMENFDEDGNLRSSPETKMISEVQEGAEYALLISTCAGAWRYLIGDTIRFTNLQQAEIIITGRTKHFLSLCGEHLSVDNMNKAIEAAAEKFDLTIPEFTVVGIKHPPLFAHQWYLGVSKAVDEKDIQEFLDQKLCELNDDYAVERKHALKNIFVKVLPLTTFYNFLESKGKIGSQHKFPRVLKGSIKEEWDAFLQNQ